jgi:hypothetical protein
VIGEYWRMRFPRLRHCARQTRWARHACATGTSSATNMS